MGEDRGRLGHGLQSTV